MSDPTARPTHLDEIDEMDWLIADIEANGPADTVAEAESRPVPEFPGTSKRTC